MSGHCPTCGHIYLFGPSTPRRCPDCIDAEEAKWDRAEQAALLAAHLPMDDPRWWAVDELNRRATWREQLAA